jgi:predicted dehydrogenase
MKVTNRTPGPARREFLKTAVAGAAGVLGFPAIVPPSALGADGTTPPSDRITVGCIGVGRMGGGHVRSFAGRREARVVAVCDVQETARKRAKNVVDRQYGDTACAAYDNFRELLERKDIDALMLAPGERWTPIMGAEAARLGKHMYYEKPLALTVEDAKAIREAVQRYGVVFQFGTQQRSSAYFRTACELVRNGKIGQLQKVVIGCSGPQPPSGPEKPTDPPPGFDWERWLGPSPWVPYSDLRVSVDWLAIYDYGLGCIGGVWGVHDIDIAQWVNNSDGTTPVAVEGAGKIYEDDIRDTICTWDIEYTYANGVKIHLMNRAAARERYRQYWGGGDGSLNGVILLGTEGWIWVSREGIQTQPDSLLRAVIGPHDQRVIHSNDHERNFLEAIRTGCPTISPIEAAAHDEMICQMGDIAVRLKQKLRWDPEKEEFADSAQANRRLSRPHRSPWSI